MKKKRRSAERNSPATPEKPAAPATRPKQDSFPIVAIGASAGGLEAFTQLFHALPKDTGMSFVLIQHLDPKHHSILPELVSKATKLSVVEVRDGMKVEANQVYVIPANVNMAISERTLGLTPRLEARGQHMPVDYFMRSLAQDQGNKGIGVILSGTASDGTLGLAAIRAEGGITFAQDEKSAKYDGMPRSAIAAGCVDFVFPPEGIARELARIGRHGYIIGPKAEEQIPQLIPEGEMGLQTIFSMLHKSTGVDFSHYRQTTINRRVQRRMVVHNMEKLKDYISHLQHNPQELDALYHDILINVTSFFRNPEVFGALKHRVFPSITKTRNSESPIRIWAPACSSGEEAYSLAIALLEYLGDRAVDTPIQLFGTDLSEAGIAKARTAIYPENIQADVSPERLRRFFVKVEGGYRISKPIRDMCIFAEQNLLADPPFSQMDLVSCRNCLIYLEPILQKRILPILHYALKPTGFLMLGTSEGIGTLPNLFAAVDRVHKIYSKKWSPTRVPVDFVSPKPPGKPASAEATRVPARGADDAWSNLEAQKEFDRALLSKYSPAAVFVNEDLEVLQSRGDTSPYLQLAPGRASLNVLKLVREGLLSSVRSALTRAKKERVPVRVDSVEFRERSQHRELSLEITPFNLASLKAPHYMIVFTEKPVATRPETAKKPPHEKTPHVRMARERQVHRLQQELAATKEHLHSVIEEQEAGNEELQSANEEILSSNEELQSTNEELETAKEELQSTNEELNTVNEELRNRNTELGQANNDLINLLNGVNTAIVMLGNDLRIRRFTPLAQKTLGLIPTDEGRPITDINPRLDLPDLAQVLTNVIETVTVSETEVRDREGRWYSLRILPYRTHENQIEGVVMMLVDIDALKSNLEQVKLLAGRVEEERASLEAVLQQMPAGVMIAEAPSGKLIMGNQQIEQIFQRPFAAIQDIDHFHQYYKLLRSDGVLFKPEDRPLARALYKGETVNAEELEWISADGKRCILQATAAPIRDRSGSVVAAVVVYTDITERRQTEKALVELLQRDLYQSQKFAAAIIETAREPLVVLDGDLRVQTANAAFYQMFQAGPGETENIFFYDLGGGQWNVPALRRLLEQILPRDTRVDDFEVEHDFPGVGRRTMLLNARRMDQEPNRQLILLSIQDVTEPRRTEKTLREQAALLDLAHDAIIVRDVDNFIRFWSRGAEEVYGWSAAEALGSSKLTLLKTRFPAPLQEINETLFQSGSWEGELEHTTSDGRQIFVASRWALRRDQAGNPAAILEINRDVTERKRVEREVRSLSAHLTQAQDEERRRIARELHDSTGQKVTALALNLAAIREDAHALPHRARTALADSSELTEQITTDLRTIAHLLHPPILDEMGLWPAIRWYVDGFSKRSGIHTDVELPKKIRRLPQEIETALYRVLQEALTNVHRHSGSAAAVVRLQLASDQVTLEVGDEGRGFAMRMPNRRRDDIMPGVGLAGMRERMQQLGGELKVHSDEKGTLIQATLPLAKAAAAEATRAAGPDSR